MADRVYRLHEHEDLRDKGSPSDTLSDGPQRQIFITPLSYDELGRRLGELIDDSSEPAKVYLEEGIFEDPENHDYLLVPYAPSLGMYILLEEENRYVPVRDPRKESGISLPDGYMRTLDSLPYREELGLEDLDGAHVLLFVNENRSPATANLRGPIIINRETGHGKQYDIRSNKRGYRLRAPIGNPLLLAVKRMAPEEE